MDINLNPSLINHQCEFITNVASQKLLVFLFRRNLDYFAGQHHKAMTLVDSNIGNGELMVRLPPEAYPIVAGRGDRMDYSMG